MAKKITKITDLGTVIQAIFSDPAGTIRASESGLSLTPIGALGSAVRVGEGMTVMVYNNSGAIAYVSFGVQAMAAPTGLTDGIPIADKEKFVLNSGENAWIRASSASVYGYQANND